jgi:hypothetical protein
VKHRNLSLFPHLLPISSLLRVPAMPIPWISLPSFFSLRPPFLWLGECLVFS